jgi:hypothetical protein
MQAGMFIEWRDFIAIDPKAKYIPWKPFILRNGWGMKLCKKGHKTKTVRQIFADTEDEAIDRSRRLYAWPHEEIAKWEIPRVGSDVSWEKLPGGWTVDEDPDDPSKECWHELPWRHDNNRWIIHADVEKDTSGNITRKSDPTQTARPDDLVPFSPEYPSEDDHNDDIDMYERQAVEWAYVWGVPYLTSARHEKQDVAHVTADWRDIASQERIDRMNARIATVGHSWNLSVPGMQDWEEWRPKETQAIFFQRIIGTDEDFGLLDHVGEAMVKYQLPAIVEEKAERTDVEIIHHLNQAIEVIENKYGSHSWTEPKISISPIWGFGPNARTEMGKWKFECRVWYFAVQVYKQMDIIWKQYEALYRKFPYDEENPVYKLQFSKKRVATKLPFSLTENPQLDDAVRSMWGKKRQKESTLSRRRGTTPSTIQQLKRKTPKMSYQEIKGESNKESSSLALRIEKKVSMSSIPEFDGTRSNIIPWFSAIDRLAEANPEMDSQLSQVIPLKLKDEAWEWWDNLEDFERDDCREGGWRIMKQYMELHWCTREFWNSLQDQADSSKFREPKHSTESPISYVNRKRKLLEYTSDGITDENLIRRILRGAPEAWTDIIPTADQENIQEFTDSIRRHSDRLIRAYERNRFPSYQRERQPNRNNTGFDKIRKLAAALEPYLTESNAITPNRSRENKPFVNELPKYMGPPLDWKVSTGTPPFKNKNPRLRAGCKICKSRHHYTMDCPQKTGERKPGGTEQQKRAAALEVEGEEPTLSYAEICAVYGEESDEGEEEVVEEEDEDQELSEN